MAARLSVTRDEDYLRVCIDAGAGCIKTEQQHVRAGMNPGDVKPVTVDIFGDGLDPVVDCTMIYDNSQLENAHVGQTAVNAWVESKRNDETDDILDLFKLAVCYEYQKNESVKNIKRFLDLEKGDTGELQILFRDVFKVILSGVHKFNLNRPSKLDVQPHTDVEDYWAAIPIELQLPMPVHWDNAQRGILFQAAREAGFEEIIIRSETLCGAAYLCLKHFKRGDLAVGMRVLLVDFGCSTAGAATVELRAEEGGDLVLVEVGYSCEDGVGGQSVTDEAWNRLLIHTCSSDFGSFEQFRDTMGISEGQFYRQFSYGFETCKRGFPVDNFYYVHITSGQEESSRIETFKLSRQYMMQCFEPPAEKVKAVISRHIKENAGSEPCAAILSGGGARNKFNREYLTEYLRSFNVRVLAEITVNKNHVARGALGLYPEPEITALPHRQSFYIALAYSHDAQQLDHLFSFESGKVVGSNAVYIDYSMKAKKHPNGGRLLVRVFGSMDDNLAGKPLKKKNGAKRPGLEEWPVNFTDLPSWNELQRLGIKSDADADGDRSYSVSTVVEMSMAEDERLMITTSLLLPSRRRDRQPRRIWTKTQELWHARRSHNVSNARAPIREFPNGKRRNAIQPDTSTLLQRKLPRTQVRESVIPSSSRLQAQGFRPVNGTSGLGIRNMQSPAARSVASGRTWSPQTLASTSPNLNQSSIPPSPLLRRKTAETARLVLEHFSDEYEGSTREIIQL